MKRLIAQLNSKEDDVMQWYTKSGNSTDNMKDKQMVTLICHLDDSSNSRYDMIIGRDILAEL